MTLHCVYPGFAIVSEKWPKDNEHCQTFDAVASVPFAVRRRRYLLINTMIRKKQKDV